MIIERYLWEVKRVDNPSVSLTADSSLCPQGARHIRKAAQPPTAMQYTREPLGGAPEARKVMEGRQMV